MIPAKTILIVEDEPKIANILADYLAMEGFETRIIGDGLYAVEEVRKYQPTAVILDRMLPNVDGLTICKQIRQFSQVPILMLTARVEEIDRLIGLNAGADDYVCKPFSVREVVARIHTILRRTHLTESPTSPSLLTFRYIKLDCERYSCMSNNDYVELTPVEFRLLKTLISKPGVVYSRDSLIQHCYDDGRIVSNRTVDSHMKNLRQKISIENEPPLIQAVYGVGYKVV
ncbi:response regulator [Alteromonas sp. C1M14]|uniref:response regulator n=1 Tax=Alteromonas sp. C1M14 TaxID=2841567 RepID=UPI001C0A6271|nr:response regulator [Alteromonas sp. C1M14]MBU2976811.1 response regulator [Alteromonas sp. C1M14]